jgi:hypothetical protein
MEAEIDYSKIKFLPAIPMPLPFDVQKRIEELRSYLDPNNPNHQPEYQYTNIKAAIKLYEEGKIDGMERVYIKDGEIVPREEAVKGPSPVFGEGRCHQLAEKHAYGHGPFGANFHEVSIGFSIFFPFTKKRAQSSCFILQIRMLLRLTPALGGDGTVLGIIAMNDTGSEILTLFDTDLPLLGNSQGYNGWIGPAAVVDATGTVTVFPTMFVQVRPVRDDNTPWGNWIDEEAIVKQPALGVSRLSGVGIRHHFYLGTAPGNHHLAVAATKGGLASLL